jgi:hypothetical protein
MSREKVFRKSKSLAGAIILCSYLLFIAQSTSAKTWTPGVTKGDYCYYEDYGVYTCSDPNVKIEVPAFEQNNTDWVRINVTNVLGSVVYQLYTLHFKNGSETFLERETNVNPEFVDTLSFSQKGIPLVASNLEPGDPFPTSKFIINDTRIIRSLGSDREAVHFSWNVSEDWGDCYLDRKTGALIQIHRVHEFTNQATGVTIEKADLVNLIGTNLWTADEAADSLTTEQWLTLIILAAFDVGLLIAAIAWNRRRKRVEKGIQEGLAELHKDHFGG